MTQWFMTQSDRFIAKINPYASKLRKWCHKWLVRDLRGWTSRFVIKSKLRVVQFRVMISSGFKDQYLNFYFYATKKIKKNFQNFWENYLRSKPVFKQESTVWYKVLFIELFQAENITLTIENSLNLVIFLNVISQQ